jgi:hypothetical protein
VERSAHWLKQNEASRYPRRLICLDSESQTAVDSGREIHSLRVAVAHFDRIEPKTREPKASELGVFLDPGECWAWVDSKSSAKERLVVFAHNLGFDLRLTRALAELPRLGWRLQAFALDSNRCWLRWRRDNRTLLMVDTVSFVGRALADFQKGLGYSKTELPSQDAPLGVWLERCKADVMLLRALVLRLMQWLEETDCGNFKMTGPAQASAHFRHRFLRGRRVLVHDDVDVLAAERTSAYAGRCEVWRHGELREPLAEWDFSLAYARIARDAALPIRLRGPITNPTQRRIRELARGMRVLAEVNVRTPEPVVPTEHDGRVLWPAGEFSSTLWDCELGLLDDVGAEWRVRRAWLYRAEPILRDWAKWIIAGIEGPDAESCVVARAVMKQWSRSLIGRFGLRYPKWEQAGETDASELYYSPYIDGDTGGHGVFLRLGTQLLEQSSVDESPDSAPAIMAWIMARARVRLWRAILAAGPENVAYVDTDALIARAGADCRLEAFAASREGEGLRVKRRGSAALLRAPRQIEFAGETRISGLSKRAHKNGRSAYTAEVWQGPAEAIRRGNPFEVVVAERRVVIRGKDMRRRHLAGGLTEPYKISPERAILSGHG